MEYDNNNMERLDILGKNPLLKTFLDPMTKLDSLSFNIMIDEAKGEIGKMDAAYGENLFHLGIYPLWTMASFSKIFGEQTSPEEQVGMINTLAAIGYQIGEMDSAAKFVDEITLTLIETEAFAAPSNPDKLREARHTVWLILSAGVYWKHVSDKDNQRLSPFRKFLNEKSDKFELD